MCVCGAGGHGRWGCGCAFCVSSGGMGEFLCDLGLGEEFG